MDYIKNIIKKAWSIKDVIKDFLGRDDVKRGLYLAFFPAVILFFETVFAISARRMTGWGVLFIPLFSVGAGCLFTLLCGLGGRRINRALYVGVTFIIAFVYGAQTVYHIIFGMYVVLCSLVMGGVGQIAEPDMVLVAIRAVLTCFVPIILFMSVPAVVFFLTKKMIVCEKTTRKQRLVLSGVSAVTILLAVALPPCIPTVAPLLGSGFSITNAMPVFGVLRTETLDLHYSAAGTDAGESFLDESGFIHIGAETPDTISSSDRKPQTMDIDFTAGEASPIIKEMGEFFSLAEPSYTNQYTGLFEGYNLIQITAEGLSQYVISEELTPTLYKMYEDGFQFTNFYNPIWAVSTHDGEYQHLTGLIPKYGAWSLLETGQNSIHLPFTMSRQFIKSGVSPVYAYHNHTYSFYRRDLTLPNMGYQYKALGNGLEGITIQWPESDLEMIDVTLPEYIADSPFHVYYMTVSGHLTYSFDDNAMARKNRDLVSGLDVSEKIRAFYACNIEFDRAMESLLRQLEEAGVADKTVISIVPDHYPYGMITYTGKNQYKYFDEMAGRPIDTTFELFKDAYLLYCPGLSEKTELPVRTDKPACPADILPTLNNLFGFEFDSRLLSGRDIFSDSTPLVIFENRNWITDKGKYIALTRSFTPFEGVRLDDVEAYIGEVNAVVRNRILMSNRILDNDYYRQIKIMLGETDEHLA
ncbi:MAG: sulfatase-like hydrolase/transferase [Oscillospiraceae bacterium]|nr:sulfatase-like hydrolase/transferase [Oscillospiraceae bacterium]